MQLKEFADQLKMRMEAEIDAISADQSNILKRTSMQTECVARFTVELKRYVVKYKFRSIEEEVSFFKHIKPDFIGRLFYFKKLFKVQLFEMTSPSEPRLRFYRKQLQRIQRCLTRHQEFYQYVLSGAGDNDEAYFSRRGAPARTVTLDERFSTRYDGILSRVQSMEMIRSYILAEVEKIENPGPDQVASMLTWTGAKTDLVELIYALQASEVFNKGNAGVKQIASQFEKVFNVTLGNYYRVYQEIRIRKTGQANFINRLKETLIERIENADA